MSNAIYTFSCDQITFVCKAKSSREKQGDLKDREKRRKRSAGTKGREKGGTQGVGVGSQVFAESAGAGAINLAGISELMNVIKIQPPAS